MSQTLVVENLVKTYLVPHAPPVEAVRGISFSIAPGECFGLLGPNGAGKSTTMRCTVGLSPATSGRITLFGHDVQERPRSARRKLGVCAQEDTLDSDFRVLDQMIRYATFFRIPVDEGRRRAEQLLEKFGLSEKAKVPVEALSGGMRRRLQVARALIPNPEILVLDEPTTGLDPEVRRGLWDILKELRGKGVAVLLSTHYMEEAERLCDRVAILHQGSIMDVAPPQTLIERHVGAGLVEEELRPGVTWKRPANLEDVYLHLTGATLNGGAS